VLPSQDSTSEKSRRVEKRPVATNAEYHPAAVHAEADVQDTLSRVLL
jgi:hypothetical protein